MSKKQIVRPSVITDANGTYPGPWVVYGPRVKTEVELEYDQMCLVVSHPDDDGNAGVACICDNEDNARAIALSVNACKGMEDPAGAIEAMREACKTAASFLDDVVSGNSISIGASRAALLAIRAALAKADGGAQ